jgi:predicted flavoprotein YhiN
MDQGKLVETVKRLRLAIMGTLGFKKAEVTAGGVALDEVDSPRMQSKRVPGLFIVGEILDLDGPISGTIFKRNSRWPNANLLISSVSESGECPWQNPWLGRLVSS